MLSRFVALSVWLTRNAIVVAALSYAPPFDRAWYRKKFAFARSVGLLFVRYHSHVLPDEAYDEADRELHDH